MKEHYINKILCGDAKKILSELPEKMVDMCVTSPPYYNLRDYEEEFQLGNEKTDAEYISKLCDIFDEVYKVLADNGTLWVNIADTYKNKELLNIPSKFAIEMCNRGWKLRNEIIWYKPNAMPCSAKDRFTIDYEKVFSLQRTANIILNSKKNHLKTLMVASVEALKPERSFRVQCRTQVML